MIKFGDRRKIENIIDSLTARVLADTSNSTAIYDSAQILLNGSIWLVLGVLFG